MAGVVELQRLANDDETEQGSVAAATTQRVLLVLDADAVRRDFPVADTNFFSRQRHSRTPKAEFPRSGGDLPQKEAIRGSCH